MKKLMSLFAAILFAGAVFATTDCDIPDGWSYYTQVSVFNDSKCTVIVNNSCGYREYKICRRHMWINVNYDKEKGVYYYYIDGDREEFNM